MVKFVLKRLGMAILQIFAVATLVFFIMHSMPGDPARLMLESGTGGNVTEEQVNALRTEMGLDKPLAEQYVTWIASLATFNFGESYYYEQPVVSFVKQRLPNTLELAFAAVILAIIFGLTSGILSALNAGKAGDTIATSAAVLGFSIPNFVMGTLLIVIFGLWLGVLPTSGFMKISRDVGMHFKYLIMPALTLALGMGAIIARVTRSSLLEEIHREYIMTLHAKGLRSTKIIFKHALKNALIPIITVIGLQMGALVGGTVVIEAIFNWPGLSSLIVESVTHRDYPMIQVCIVIIAAIYITINVIVDVLYRKIDPKMK